MPFGNRTGPLGLGPKTGRGLGYCSGFVNPGFAVGWLASGRGFRRWLGCFGRGRGWRNWFRATGLPGWARVGYDFPYDISLKDEEDFLKTEADYLKQQLDWIESRLEALKKKQEKTSE